MEQLAAYLDQGVLGLTVFTLLLALVWVVRQWRQAERDKDALHEARLQDAKEMAVLATEVKNSVATLVRITSER